MNGLFNNDAKKIAKYYMGMARSGDKKNLAIAYLKLQGKLRGMHIALADSIRRPMGVIPMSADGLVTRAELQEAEERREIQNENNPD